MADSVEGQERTGRYKRRATRVQMRVPLHCRLHPIVDATIVDLSLGGAQMEHTVPVRPGGACELVIKEGGGEFRLLCRVLRSVIIRSPFAMTSHEVRYRTGLEFMNLRPPQETFLNALIRRYSGATPSKTSPDVAVIFSS